MRKLVFFIFIGIGATVGAATALSDGVGVLMVMMSIGGVVGLVLGGLVTGVGARTKVGNGFAELPRVHAHGTSPRDRDRNYWRDRGHPPFMKPPDAIPDRHMLDPDRQD